MNETIIVPLDGSKTGEAALSYVEDLVSKLAPGVQVEVVLLQVLSEVTSAALAGAAEAAVLQPTKDMEQNKKKAMDYLFRTGDALRSKGATVTARVAVGHASEEIVKTAEEIDATIIAMSTHGRSGLRRWAFGSVTDRVLRHEAHIPIIIVRAPKS